MNETVTIKEGGLTRRFAPIDKLKVNTTDNKDSMWVSAGKANTGVLHASENGIYIASEDGYEAYSEVIVRVTKDSFEGDTSFDDWDYETPDMDLSNWDPETIDDFELDPDGFNDVFNNENEWKDINKPIDIKMDNPKIQDTKMDNPKIHDTKISGIDPVTGNEMEVGLDADGYLTESTLPSSIKIEIPPDKLQYVDGQPIIFRGMVVKGYTADGELWSDTTHPNGVIQHSELTFPVTVASIEEVTEYQRKIGDITCNCSPGNTFTNTANEHIDAKEVFSVTSGEGPFFVFGCDEYNESVDAHYIGGYICSKNNFGGNVEIYQDGGIKQTDHRYASKTYKIIDGVTYNVYMLGRLSYQDYYSPTTTAPLNYNKNSVELAVAACYGDETEESGKQVVPVQYVRSDGEVLEDSFTIEVLPDPDGALPDYTRNSILYNGTYYEADKNLNAEAHYASGTVWVRGSGTIYNTRDAVALGLLKPKYVHD